MESSSACFSRESRGEKAYFDDELVGLLVEFNIALDVKIWRNAVGTKLFVLSLDNAAIGTCINCFDRKTRFTDMFNFA